jgi:acetyl-CoA acetyltransferase
MVTEDEAPGKLDVQRLPQLRPAFAGPDGAGTVTAGNASPITDGAAALVLMSAARAAQLNIEVHILVRVLLCRGCCQVMIGGSIWTEGHKQASLIHASTQ